MLEEISIFFETLFAKIVGTTALDLSCLNQLLVVINFSTSEPAANGTQDVGSFQTLMEEAAMLIFNHTVV